MARLISQIGRTGEDKVGLTGSLPNSARLRDSGFRLRDSGFRLRDSGLRAFLRDFVFLPCLSVRLASWLLAAATNKNHCRDGTLDVFPSYLHTAKFNPGWEI